MIDEDVVLKNPTVKNGSQKNDNGYLEYVEKNPNSCTSTPEGIATNKHYPSRRCHACKQYICCNEEPNNIVESDRGLTTDITNENNSSGGITCDNKTVFNQDNNLNKENKTSNYNKEKNYIEEKKNYDTTDEVTTHQYNIPIEINPTETKDSDFNTPAKNAPDLGENNQDGDGSSAVLKPPSNTLVQDQLYTPTPAANTMLDNSIYNDELMYVLSSI